MAQKHNVKLTFCVVTWVWTAPLTRRVATTSRPMITHTLWDELRAHFLHSLADYVATYNIPDELIFKIDQTPSKFITTGNMTMVEKGSKHVPLTGSNDRRAITLTLIETLSGDILPFQVIFKGKTERYLSKDKYPDGFLLSYNEKHCSNETETLRLLEKLFNPYIEKSKVEKNLPQHSLIIWDAFKAESADAVKKKINDLNVDASQVPKNLTHLFQLLDCYKPMREGA